MSPSVRRGSNGPAATPTVGLLPGQTAQFVPPSAIIVSSLVNRPSRPEAIMWLRNSIFLLSGLLLAIPVSAEEKPAAEAKDFSGPQKGEAITPFNIRGVLG